MSRVTTVIQLQVLAAPIIVPELLYYQVCLIVYPVLKVLSTQGEIFIGQITGGIGVIDNDMPEDLQRFLRDQNQRW